MDELNFNITDIDYIIHKAYPLGCTYSIPLRSSYRILYIISGNVKFHFSDRVVEGKKGDIVLHPVNDVYTLTSHGEEHWEFCVISFFTDVPLPDMAAVTTPEHGSMMKEQFLLADKTWKYKKPGYKLYVKSLLYSIIFNLINAKNVLHYSWEIDKVISHMMTNYNKKISIKEMADIAGYSSSHFNSEFGRLVGKSPMRYLNEIRIDHAKELLRTGMFSITEIAENCGFENMYYFSNVFKKYTGVSPSKF